MITTYEELKEKIDRVEIAEKNIYNNQATKADLSASLLMPNPKTEPKININLNTREIEVKDFYCFGVENDHNAETIYFETNRYFDDIDLYNSEIIIQQINGLNQQQVFPVTYKYINYNGDSMEGDRLTFCWTLSSLVFLAAGKISFSVRFYELKEDSKSFKYNLNTKIAEAYIAQGFNALNLDNGIKETNDLDITISKLINLEKRYLLRGYSISILEFKDYIYEDKGLFYNESEIKEGDITNV